MRRILKSLIIMTILASLVVLFGCTGKSISKPTDSIQELMEDQAYVQIKERTKLPVYKPSYTAGYTFSPTDPQGKPNSGQEDSIWYKNGDSYFRVVNSLVGDIGDIKTEEIGTINGQKAIITSDGLIALWNEKYNDYTYSYGIELYQGSNLPKHEVIRIIKSMKPIE